MAIPAILRRSVSKAAPFATRFIGAPRTVHSVAAFSAVKRVTVSPSVVPAAGYFAGRRFLSPLSTTVDDGHGISADKRLLEVVQSEIDVVEKSEDYGKDVAAPGDFPFSIEDNLGEQTFTLRREFNGEDIAVEVSMPYLVTGEEDEGGNDDEDQDPHTDSSVPLLVTVTKKYRAPYLEFDCTASPDEIRINGLSLKNPETEEVLAYEGPDFSDLDENLQKAFYKYLEVRGIKPSATDFLHEYMIEKDNKEYLRWLKDIKSFVEA